MKAIILTAGYGRRMRPLSNQTHKTLLNVAGRTIIERIIDGLVDNGITDIAIVTTPHIGGTRRLAFQDAPDCFVNVFGGLPRIFVILLHAKPREHH